MSAPRAQGAHAPWTAVPARIRAWAEARLGAPIASWAECTGGMSPGCATRLVTADGRRAFCKAVGAELNPDSPTLFRREIDVLRLVGSDPLWADLIDAYDDGPGERGWVALLLEDVEGHHPDLADETTMHRLLAATDALSARINTRRDAAPPPAGGAFEPGLTDLRVVFSAWLGSLDRVLADPTVLPAELAPAWLPSYGGALREVLAGLAAEEPTHLVHWDIRNDNLLQRADGSIVFLDWGAAGWGQDWLDPLLARLERVHTSWFDGALGSSPALARVGDEAVTAWLTGIGVHLAWRAITATDVNLPTLAAFRRQESARFLGAAARRLGVIS